MAVPANTTQTFAMTGIREDLRPVIELVSPTETPIFSMLKKGDCDNRTPEWTQHTVRASNADNAAIEGDDVAPDAQGQPVKVKNIVQLLDETISVSTTANAVKSIDGKKEMKRQTILAGFALKLDIEKRLGGNYPSVLGAAGVAGKFGGMGAWITTNLSKGAAGVNGGYSAGIVAAHTPGTPRAFTEALLKASCKAAWDSGGNPSVVILGSGNKQTASTFTGIAQNTNEVKGSDKVTIVGSADVYVSDYGKHKLIPSREADNTMALGLQLDKWEIKYLQPFSTDQLAKTGHNTKSMMSVELTLASYAEKFNFCITALT